MQKAVIIGAGPAGLTAAHELLTRAKEAYSVTVLEESDTVGGISRTVRYKGNRMDIGGHRFFSKEQRVTDWWLQRLPAQGAPAFDDKKLGRESTLVPGGPDPELTDRVMLTRNRVSRIYYDHKFFDYPISAKIFRQLGLGKTAQAGLGFLSSCVHKLPEDSLENFYINRFGKKLYSMFFQGYTEKLWGRPPAEISADWGAQRVKGLSITAVLKDMMSKMRGTKDAAHTETSLIERFQYPKFGPGQLWEEVADEVRAMGGEIRFGCQVTGVHTKEGRVRALTVRTAQGEEEVAGDFFFSSMPVKDLIADMEAPADIARIAAGLPYRDFVTVGLLLKKLALPKQGDVPTLGNIVPDCWIYIQDAGVKLGRLQIFNNWSPYLVAKPEETVWVGLEYFCQEGDAFWNMPMQQCLLFAAQELQKIGVLASAEDILDFHRERVKKAYPAYFDTYAEMDKLIDYLNGFSNLFCVGRNGQHRYNNMDHSMMTAFEAVDNLLAGRADNANVWNVNTDQAYQEEKQA